VNIGILGGTFDPVHQGHLYVAKCVLASFDLDRVLLMVARQPPHKDLHRLTNPYHRYAMAALATRRMLNVFPCSWELCREGPSYTIDTLRGLNARHPADKFCFIAGGDSLQEVHLWRKYDKLLTEYSFVFVQRLGLEVDLDQVGLEEPLRKRFRVVWEDQKQLLSAGTHYLVRAQPPPVSSTRIRTTISAGHSPSLEEVPEEVLDYIRKHQLYE
jgi:nicotinate-nucleotide adenylyltransferase